MVEEYNWVDLKQDNQTWLKNTNGQTSNRMAETTIGGTVSVEMKVSELHGTVAFKSSYSKKSTIVSV